MPTTVSKKILMDSIEQMPEQISLHELLEKIRTLSKIESGIKASEEGRTLSHEEAKKRFEQWLK